MDAADREEIKVKLKKVDKTGNGKIRLNEFASLLLDLFPDWTNEDVNLVFDAVDVKADGMLDYCEFIDWVFYDDGEQGIIHLETKGAVPELTRIGCLEELFKALDARHSGRLKDAAMFYLVSRLGFNGDEDSFENEYAAICKKHNCHQSAGIDTNVFMQVFNMNGGDYYVDDKTLQSLLGDLSKREEKLRSLFKVFDTQSTGRLKAVDMFQVAQKHGFDPRREKEFTKRTYASMSEQYGFNKDVGVDLKTFVQVCSDLDGEFYLEDDSLQQLLDEGPRKGKKKKSVRLGAESNTSAPSQVLVQIQQAESVDFGPLGTPEAMEHEKWAARSSGYVDVTARKNRCAKLFKKLDVKGSGKLRLPEMFGLATMLGFEGDQAEFENEYETLCEDMDCDPTQGLDANMFFLATQFEDTDVYIDDTKLIQLVGENTRSPGMLPSPRMPRPPSRDT